jgi:hypothetical protein
LLHCLRNLVINYFLIGDERKEGEGKCEVVVV